MNKRILIISLVVISIFLGWFKWQAGKGIEQEKPLVLTEEQGVAEGVSLTLDFGDEEISTYSGIPTEGTVFDVLEKVASDEGVVIERQDYDFGILVQSIAGKENSKERAWIYFVNGKSGDMAADKKQVKDGDVIEWKYIKPVF